MDIRTRSSSFDLTGTTKWKQMAKGQKSGSLFENKTHREGNGRNLETLRYKTDIMTSNMIHKSAFISSYFHNFSAISA